MAKNAGVERIDTLEFDNAIKSMNKALKSFKNAKSNIKKFTDPVVDSWEGEGAKAFKKVYKKLKTELNDEEENLSNVKKDLENIKASYESWDQELSNQFKGDTPSSKNEKKK